jgi:hypothetical protein
VARAKRNQQTAPLSLTLSPEETVTVIDPRHPLFGYTLPLLGIINKQYQGQCCLIWVYEGVEQLVPVAATDRVSETPEIFPLPVDVPSVQHLVALWEGILGKKAQNEIHHQPTIGIQKGGDKFHNTHRRTHGEAKSGLAAADANSTAERQRRSDSGRALSSSAEGARRKTR